MVGPCRDLTRTIGGGQIALKQERARFQWPDSRHPLLGAGHEHLPGRQRLSLGHRFSKPLYRIDLCNVVHAAKGPAFRVIATDFIHTLLIDGVG